MNSIRPLHIQETIYLKDPESSTLGKNILSGSIELIAEKGFEQFTFKKLAQKIESTEASVYRYFESKHKLLLYLVNWYWTWMLYRLNFEIANIEDPREQLSRVINLFSQKTVQDANFGFINEELLQLIIINEAPKSYLTHQVDQENTHGDFKAYEELVQRIVKIILEIKPDYPYATMLVNTLIEGTQRQNFFSKHLPNLTCCSQENSIQKFYNQLVFKCIE